jgi:hypothetical protein
MARNRLTFKQADVIRAVKAVRAAGLDVVRVEISEGKISLVNVADEKAPNAYDRWEASRGAR